MGAAKESPATQVLTWAVGKLDEASKVDWMEKLNSLAASKPAYLKNVVLTTSASSHSAPAPSPSPAPTPAPSGGGGASREQLEGALDRAIRAEARADVLAQRVDELEAKLAAQNSHSDVDLQAEDDDHHKHWWSRQH